MDTGQDVSNPSEDGMGKASRNKRISAREKIAAQREAARRAERRQRLLITVGSVLGVVVIVLAFVVLKVLNTPKASAGASANGAAVMRTIAKIPASTLARVGAGTGQSNKPRAITGPPLTSGGKPEVLYMGAEYCPFCAAERWAVAVALSRFGTWSNVSLIRSAPAPEVYPNTATLTFYKSSYTSKYLTFVSVEEQTVTHAPLQKATAEQDALIAKYDAPPYVSSASAGAIPFIDIGNEYALAGGSSFVPDVLKGRTWSQIAAALSNPSSPIAQQVDGAANYLTAAICKTTNSQPADVCSSPAITALMGKI